MYAHEASIEKHKNISSDHIQFVFIYQYDIDTKTSISIKTTNNYDFFKHANCSWIQKFGCFSEIWSKTLVKMIIVGESTNSVVEG